MPRFLPPDIIFQRQTTSSDGGLKDVYTSVQLAHTFAQSSLWHDPAGGVDLTYVIRNGGVYQCELDESPWSPILARTNTNTLATSTRSPDGLLLHV